MNYRRLGRSGLKVSELSYGSWVTFGTQLAVEGAKACIRRAHELGVNFFDNAEAYANGVSESIMGQALKEYRREELVVSTKLFWGGAAPNQTGLSRKHLMEGVKNSLRRLDMEYVDLIFCHRPDPETPIEETVLAMNDIVRAGHAFYWGTSEWSAEQLQEAYRISREYRVIGPTMEQPQYNMLVRERFEKEYAPLYKEFGLGTTIWSPLASGVLSGKYRKGIPEGSRLANVGWLREAYEKDNLLADETLGKVEKLAGVAKDVGCSTAQLALAWCLKNPNVSTVITGASRVEQVEENLKAAQFVEQIDNTVMKKIETILANKPV
ncbi:MAG TPA: aldo/keto reductase [Spirochaetia bacterium]|nr:aldo/keto reductase [Spirochaetia bacterium]